MDVTRDKVVVMKVMAAIVEAISEGDEVGVNGGILYAAMMGRMTMDTFNKLMGGLVDAGAVTKTGQCYQVTVRGMEYIAAVKRIEMSDVRMMGVVN